MSRQDVKNPWRVTEREADMLDEVCRLGTPTRAAAKLGIGRNTANSYLRRAKERMGLVGEGSINIAIAKWAAWRATDGKGVPA